MKEERADKIGRVFTLVCTRCPGGWESERPEGKCPLCGKDLERRGEHVAVPLR